MKSQLLSFPTVDNEIITIDYYQPRFDNEVPILIILHGFKGFKNWGFFPFTSDYFRNNGFATFTLNFSLNGVTDSIGDLFDNDKFSKNTLSRELDEVGFVLDWLVNTGIEILNIPWNKKVFLLGHSRGGGIAALANASLSQITSSVHWASVGKFGRTTQRQNLLWKENGKLDIPNSRTGQILSQNYSYLEDIHNNSDRLSIKNAVEQTTKPMLFIHGSEDLVIKPQEVSILPELNSSKIVFYKEIKQTGHTFSVVHPMIEIPSVFQELLSTSLMFFNKDL